MIVRCLFAKVFEAVECLFTFLYFIEYQQSLSGEDGDITVKCQLLDETLGRLGDLKNGFDLRLAVEVEPDTIVETLPAKFRHDPGLSYLAGSLQQERFPVRRIFPSLQCLNNSSLYFHIITLLSADFCSKYTFFRTYLCKDRYFLYLPQQNNVLIFIRFKTARILFANGVQGKHTGLPLQVSLKFRGCLHVGA